MSRRQKNQAVATATAGKRASIQVVMSWPCVITTSGTTMAAIVAGIYASDLSVWRSPVMLASITARSLSPHWLSRPARKRRWK